MSIARRRFNPGTTWSCELGPCCALGPGRSWLRLRGLGIWSVVTPGMGVTLLLVVCLLGRGFEVLETSRNGHRACLEVTCCESPY